MYRKRITMISLVLTSYVGILLILWSIPSAIMGVVQIMFLLQRRSDTTPKIFTKMIFRMIQAVGRFIGMPIAGLILFLNGWRMDQTLGIGVLILTIGVIMESSIGIAEDYQKWRQRTG